MSTKQQVESVVLSLLSAQAAEIANHLPAFTKADAMAAVTAFAELHGRTHSSGHDADMGLVTIDSLFTPRGTSWKLENIVLNWRRLMDVVPDVTLAVVAATLPPWAWPFAGLYVCNKLLANGRVELTQLEAVTMAALWKTYGPERPIEEPAALVAVNETRAKFALPPAGKNEFGQTLTRLAQLRCVQLIDGHVVLKEKVRCSVA